MGVYLDIFDSPCNTMQCIMLTVVRSIFCVFSFRFVTGLPVRRTAVMNCLAYLAKEDPLGYFAAPVDADLLPGYRDVVNGCKGAGRLVVRWGDGVTSPDVGAWVGGRVGGATVV